MYSSIPGGIATTLSAVMLIGGGAWIFGKKLWKKFFPGQGGNHTGKPADVE